MSKTDSYWTELWVATTGGRDRKSTRLNSSHLVISYAVFCLKKKHARHFLAALMAEEHALLRIPCVYSTPVAYAFGIPVLLCPTHRRLSEGEPLPDSVRALTL